MSPLIPNGSTTASELPTDLTLLLPPALVAEVLELLNSQEEFMSKAKQSGAAVRALTTRYDTLLSVWDDLKLSKPNEQLMQLRNEARAIRLDLKRSDESVTSDLALRYENEWMRIDEDVQEQSEELNRRKKTWTEAFSIKRTSFLRSLRMRKKELTELRETLSLLKSNGELTITKQRTSYEQQKSNLEESGTHGRSNSDDLQQSEQSLTNLRESLTKRKEELQKRKRALPLRKEQLDETVALSQMESAELTRKRASLKVKKQGGVTDTSP